MHLNAYVMAYPPDGFFCIHNVKLSGLRRELANQQRGFFAPAELAWLDQAN